MCEGALLKNMYELIPCSIKKDEKVPNMESTSLRGRILMRYECNQLLKDRYFGNLGINHLPRGKKYGLLEY